MKVYAFESSDWPEAEKHGLTKQKVLAEVRRGLLDVKKLLPTLSKSLNIAVRPYFENIIPEYGTGGYTRDFDFIEIWFDKMVPHGAQKTLEHLYETVFHEACHAARWNTEGLGYDNRIIAGAVFEGLATVFEREHANGAPLWGRYEDEATMHKWLTELQAAGTDWSKRGELFFTNPDGRRWIGYKTGTWLADQAIQHPGERIVDLVGMPADDILTLAKVE